MLNAFEADIFLVTMHKCRLEPPYNLPLPEELNLRAFHLYFTYIKLRTLIKHSFYTAGLDDSFMVGCSRRRLMSFSCQMSVWFCRTNATWTEWRSKPCSRSGVKPELATSFATKSTASRTIGCTER